MTTNKTFYITTPIYYPSGRLHIGNTYTTVACDVMARYKRLMGHDVYYLTGMDEHGQKIELKSKELGLDPQTYVDGMAEDIQKLWKQLRISNDGFIRTTDPKHMAAVQNIFERFLEQGDIYLGKYEGWYSVSDEEFFTESQLEEVYKDENGQVIGGVAPSGHQVQWVEEPTYFFKMSRYADCLVEYYEAMPEFILPESRKNEMINNFIKPGLEDLSVTRTSFTWGVPVKSDPEHVIYVWLDALTNYITALGYGTDEDELFQKFWPANVHMIGKEIVRFHAIYWPIFLMALDLPLPKQIFGHGWLLMKDGKMSKSKGNVVYPDQLVERYGLDALRYYLMREVSFGSDGVFTPESYITRINVDLANDLGNLLNRTIAMINKYFDGEVPMAEATETAFDADFRAVIQQEVTTYFEEMEAMRFSRGLMSAWTIVSRANKYIDETTPWTLAKDEAERGTLARVMVELVDALRIVATLVQPVLLDAPEAIVTQLGFDVRVLEQLEGIQSGQLPEQLTVVKKGQPIFPRLDLEEETQVIRDWMTPTKQAEEVSEEEEGAFDPSETTLNLTKKAIKYDQFEAIELKVAEVIACQKVKGADKLLQFKLDAGDEGYRQILSGVAEFYPDPEALVGEKVCIVANLKPRKMRGELSQGMILSAEKDGQLEIVRAPKNIPNGAIIA
ncbi:methionine--tRNA ligase [Atopobacter phocae]|uniref:methionine--tRNA ligase n=1 Tax=Atopobacter phocae TaxID=136492 RepID=UPI00046F5DEE|nr:methionine--tRNA ligase [Atopobacter phocae]